MCRSGSNEPPLKSMDDAAGRPREVVRFQRYLRFEKLNISEFSPVTPPGNFGNDGCLFPENGGKSRLEHRWRDVRVVDRAALEMPCPLPGPGFESRSLRHKACKQVRFTGFSYTKRYLLF